MPGGYPGGKQRLSRAKPKEVVEVGEEGMVAVEPMHLPRLFSAIRCSRLVVYLRIRLSKTELRCFFFVIANTLTSCLSCEPSRALMGGKLIVLLQINTAQQVNVVRPKIVGKNSSKIARKRTQKTRT